MTADVDLDLDALELTLTRLQAVLEDFSSVSSTVNDVEDAIGRPHGRGDLRSRVGDFESGWNGNREVIQENLQAVFDHLQAIVDGFAEADAAMVAPAEGEG